MLLSGNGNSLTVLKRGLPLVTHLSGYSKLLIYGLGQQASNITKVFIQDPFAPFTLRYVSETYLLQNQ